MQSADLRCSEVGRKDGACFVTHALGEAQTVAPDVRAHFASGLRSGDR